MLFNSNLKKQHMQALSEINALRDAYSLLLSNWNQLVGRINAKGGEAFLMGSGQMLVQQLNDEDIKKLISLCHPDKHNNSHSANEMTKKLLSIRTKKQFS